MTIIDPPPIRDKFYAESLGISSERSSKEQTVVSDCTVIHEKEDYIDDLHLYSIKVAKYFL